MEVDEGKRQQRDHETEHLRIKSFRKPLPPWTQASLGVSETSPHPQHPKMLGYLVFLPFLLRSEGPQTRFEGSQTLWGCVLLGDELHKG